MADKMMNILKRYPKSRPQLDAGQAEIYEKEYLSNRSGAGMMNGLSQKMESWMHRKVSAVTKGPYLLEIGAGTLNHVPYLNMKRNVLDIIEPMYSLFENSPDKHQIRNFYTDITQVRNRYNTIYSIAALEHICDLPQLIARCGLQLAEDGVFVNAIPCEGGLAWGAAWRCTTGLSYKLRTGHSYRKLMSHEHVNDFNEMVALVRYFFKDVKVSYFPLFGKHLSLYSCITARSPDLERCNEVISSAKAA